MSLKTTDYDSMMKTLRQSFSNGKVFPLCHREKFLKSLRLMFDENLEKMCEALNKDLGRPRQEAITLELNLIRNEIVLTLENLKAWMKPDRPSKSLVTFFDDLYIYKDPYGVVLVIGAWNYPIQLSLLPLVGAIAAGNCAVIKPSELAPNCAELIAELVPHYLNSECFQVVCGGVPETQALLQQKFDYIFFTGSTKVGKVIYEAASKHLTPVTLELGGKSPVYIDNYVDINVAVRRLLWGKLSNSGQTCVAADYLLCPKFLLPLLLDQIRDVMKEWYRDGVQQSKSFGRIVNSTNFHRLLKLLEPKEKIFIGGKFDENELFIEPTVMIDVSLTDSVMQEEIFGPILPIITVNGVDDAISIINSLPKPLALYIFSENKVVQKRFAKFTSSGAIVFNDTMLHLAVDSLPFGGVGPSGIGAYHGKHSFDTFTHKKAGLKRNYNSIGESLSSGRYPPYSEKKTNSLTKLTRHRSCWFPLQLLILLLVFLIGAGVMYFVMRYGLNYERK